MKFYFVDSIGVCDCVSLTKYTQFISKGINQNCSYLTLISCILFLSFILFLAFYDVLNKFLLWLSLYSTDKCLQWCESYCLLLLLILITYLWFILYDLQEF